MSTAMDANHLYSAFVLDLVTFGCFRAIQMIGLPPNYTSEPEVDLLVSTQEPQLALEKVLTISYDDGINSIPNSMVPARYRRIFFDRHPMIL